MSILENNRTEGGYGFFLHFLSENCQGNIPMTPARWNAITELVDVDLLAEQVHSGGASYFFITLGQNSGYYCAPNPTLDRLCGRSKNGSHSSRRNLVTDLADALQKYHIPLGVYLPCHAPAHDNAAMVALHGIPSWDYHLWSPADQAGLTHYAEKDPRLKSFLRNWELIVEDWSRQFGNKIFAWWFDGCFYRKKLYDFPDEPNFISLAKAAKRGNAKALFAINAGVERNPQKITDCEDYTAGETNDPENCCCVKPLVDKIRYHVLTFAGSDWHTLPFRYNAKRMAAISANIINGGGCVSWDLPYEQKNGCFSAETMDLLADFQKELRKQMTTKISADFQILKLPFREIGKYEAPGLAKIAFFSNSRKENEVTVELPVDRNSFAIQKNGFSRSWHYDTVIRQRLTWLSKAPVYPIKQGETLLAEIKIGRNRKRQCVVEGFVFEQREYIKIHPDYWRGSCLELFFADSKKIIQRFFPPEKGLKCGYLLKNHKYLSDSDFTVSERWSKQGRLIKIMFPPPTATGSWKIEIKVTVMTKDGIRISTLGGSAHPESSDDKFVVLTWKD